jgi:hypothetical protein
LACKNPPYCSRSKSAAVTGNGLFNIVAAVFSNSFRKSSSRFSSHDLDQPYGPADPKG